jgi:hypothetical protein
LRVAQARQSQHISCGGSYADAARTPELFAASEL